MNTLDKQTQPDQMVAKRNQKVKVLSVSLEQIRQQNPGRPPQIERLK